MNKKTVKMISLFLAVFIMMLPLNACNSEKTTSDDYYYLSVYEEVDGTESSTSSKTESSSKQQSGSSQSGSSQKTDDKVLEKIPGSGSIVKNDKNIDFKGATVTVGYWADYVTGQGTSEEAVRMKAVNTLIEKTYNCKLEFVNVLNGRDTALKSSIMAGKPKVDVFACQGVGAFYDYYSTGCLYAMEDLKNVDMNDSSRYVVPDLTEFDGKHYGLTTKIFSWMSKAFSQCLLVNFDLTSNAGYSAEKLYALQDSKKWNWDAFEEVCKALNTKGVTAMSDIATETKEMYNFDMSFAMYQGMLAANNTDWIQRNGNSFKFSGGSDSAIAVLDRYTKWAKAGYIKFNSNALTDFKNGKYAFLPTVYCTMITNAGRVWDGKSNLGFMYYPMGPGANGYVSPQYEQTYIVVPKGVTNPQGIGAIVNALNTPLFTEAESMQLNKQSAAANSNNSSSLQTMVSIYNDANTWKVPVSVYGKAASIGYTADNSKLGWFDYVKKVALGEMTTNQAISAFETSANRQLAAAYN